MYKKLDKEQISQILETGISEFATHGLDRASMNTIAKNAGVSVGVLYKYYEDKDQFFLACVRYSLELLNQVLDQAVSMEEKPKQAISQIVDALMENGKKHPDYYRMYNEITSGSCRKYARVLAEEIEKVSAKAYSELFENAKKRGQVRQDLDPRLFAFFFDNVLMMLQFSYSCDYYKERLKLYCGEEIMEQDDRMKEQLLSFLNAALTIQE